MPTDLGTWGLILAILALFLMYPVSLLANITTPIVKNWWASRSKKQLQARISSLEEDMAHMNILNEDDDISAMLFWAIEITILVIVLTSRLILGSLVLLTILLGGLSSSPAAVTIGCLFIMNLLIGYVAERGIRQYRQRKFGILQKRIENNVSKLKAKL